MCLHFIHILSFSFLFHRNGVFWDACWSWLGARPRTALWQTGGNGTHAVRSAVGRAVGRTAHTGGQDCGTSGRPTGYSLCKGSIPLGGSPRLLSVARALLPKRVFYLEGGGRKPGQWERARARVRQTWGFFMGVYSGEAYGRRVRALQGEGRGFPLTFCLFVATSTDPSVMMLVGKGSKRRIEWCVFGANGRSFVNGKGANGYSSN